MWGVKEKDMALYKLLGACKGYSLFEDYTELNGLSCDSSYCYVVGLRDSYNVFKVFVGLAFCGILFYARSSYNVNGMVESIEKYSHILVGSHLRFIFRFLTATYVSNKPFRLRHRKVALNNYIENPASGGIIGKRKERSRVTLRKSVTADFIPQLLG